MKANGVISNFLLLATLSLFSSTPAEAAGYAIDTISCWPAQQLFIEAQLKRASTIGKFVSLNLGDNMSNRQGWYLNGLIMNFVTKLMGDARDALYQAQWVFGGALGVSGTGIVGFEAEPMDKDVAGPYDVVFYCNADRVSSSSGGFVYDPGKKHWSSDWRTHLICEQSDSALATGNPALVPDDAAAGCEEVFSPGAPSYVFWQLPGDAARVSFCEWFLKMVIDSAVPSTSVFADTRRLDELRDRVATWPLNWGPWGFGTPTPNIQKFQLFDAIMISAVGHHAIHHVRTILTFFTQLTHTIPAGSRKPSSVGGPASTYLKQINNISHGYP
ncbi:hypothetical protein IMSHALPRED_004586 [Imshaugia aleurites]|uniref:Uncharacterized protein n=1 Tax=Imshaugia aleurites TaxID=172621 RepID=A0A8H3F934_9LECA|nr:hypothetical protein IMSHALPRED_004586 [Imshaugia aleurites]